MALNDLTGGAVKAWIPEIADALEDVLTGQKVLPGDYSLPPYGFVWLKPVGQDRDNLPFGPNAPQPDHLSSDKN